MVLVHDTLSHCALEVYEVSTKFNSFNSVHLTERTKIAFSYVTSGIIWKIARVFFFVDGTSSECVLQTYEVSLKYL